MKSWLALLLWLAPAVGAEQIFVRNRPFKAVEKRETGWASKLPDLATALGLELTPVGNSWVLGPAAEELPEGEVGVYYRGSRLQSVNSGLEVLDLKAFIQELGGRYVVNKGLGTIDLYMETAMVSRAMSCPNVHVLMFHRPKASGQQVAGLGHSLLPIKGLEPVPIDFEDPDHPHWQQWGRYWTAESQPLVVLVDPSGRVLGKWTSQLPPVAELQQLFQEFVSRRAQINAQQVASPSRGGGGNRSSG
jgi:hypothetical protein